MRVLLHAKGYLGSWIIVMTAPQILSYPEKFVRWIPLPYWLTYILVWEGIFGVDYLLSLSVPGAQEHFREFGCLVAFFALVCVAIIYCSRVCCRLFTDLLLFIDHNPDELYDWYKTKISRSYEGVRPFVFAVLFVVVENFTVGSTIRQLTPPDTSIYYLRIAYEIVGFFFLGIGIWALLNILLIPIGLTKFRIRVTVNQISGRGLQALGSAYFKMSLAITMSFIPLVVAAIVSSLIEDVSIALWLGAGTMVIFCFFLLPQIGIHRIMAFEKQQRLLSFANHLEDAMERSLKDPTSENMQRLKELFELQAYLRGMNEWPFNTNTLWQLITALLIPLMLAMLEIFF